MADSDTLLLDVNMPNVVSIGLIVFVWILVIVVAAAGTSRLIGKNSNYA